MAIDKVALWTLQHDVVGHSSAIARIVVATCHQRRRVGDLQPNRPVGVRQTRSSSNRLITYQGLDDFSKTSHTTGLELIQGPALAELTCGVLHLPGWRLRAVGRASDEQKF